MQLELELELALLWVPAQKIEVKLIVVSKSVSCGVECLKCV